MNRNASSNSAQRIDDIELTKWDRKYCAEPGNGTKLLKSSELPCRYQFHTCLLYIFCTVCWKIRRLADVCRDIFHLTDGGLVPYNNGLKETY